MTQKSYPVQTRKTDAEDAEWECRGENATVAAVNRYNRDHGWYKARLVLPEAVEESVKDVPVPEQTPEEKVRANMADLARLTETK